MRRSHEPRPWFGAARVLGLFIGCWLGLSVRAEPVPGQWLVKYRPPAPAPAPGGPRLQGPPTPVLPAGSRVLRPLALPGWQLIEIPPGPGSRAAAEELRQRPGVAAVEPNFRYQLHTVPTDPQWPALWGLERIGAPAAWNASIGQSNLVVAILDTGLDLRHPDLQANVWTNPDEIPDNGLDDDGDGVVDDVHGADFADGDGDPTDDAGHGTHVAGTIGAVANNGRGVAGVCWQVRLLPVRVGRVDGFGDTASLVAAFEYVVRLKRRGVDVRVINCSWGGSFPSAALREAIVAAGEAGILIVCSAGNDRQDNDALPVFPAGYDCPEILSVAASAACDEPANFSNYGRTTVHLAAPGRDILSTFRGGEHYAVLSGTSMAAPHVTGAAALLAAYRTNLTAGQLRAALLAGVQPLAAWSNRVSSGGRLDLGRALAGLAGGTAPAPVPSPVTPASRISPVTRLASGRWASDNSGEGAISPDGRWVAFSSYATNLVPGDVEGFLDVFLYDRRSNTVVRVSQTPDGIGAQGDSTAPALSADGRFVAFVSTAPNLAGSDGNRETDVFVWDRDTRRIELISARLDNVTAGNGASDSPSISADGLLVAFASDARDLVSGDRNGARDVFLRDRTRRVTECVSVTAGGLEAQGTSEAPSISADGRYVAFHSGARNLIDGDGNSAWDVFVRDRVTGLVELASGRGLSPALIPGNGDSVYPVLSGDGRFVLFYSLANNFDAQDGGFVGVFLRDRLTGELTRVNARPGAVAGGDAYADGLSADGRYATFTTDDPTLGPGGGPGLFRAWVYDRLSGNLGLAGRNPAGSAPDEGAVYARPSADGRFLVYATRAANAVPGHGSGGTDVFVEDRGEARPDLGVRTVGEAAFSGLGTVHPEAPQRAGKRIPRGDQAVFEVALVNGGGAQSFAVLAESPAGNGAKGWRYHAFLAADNHELTSSLDSGAWLTPLVPAGSNLVVRLVIDRSAGPEGDAVFAVRLVAKSGPTGNELDAVTAVTEVDPAPPGFALVSRSAGGLPAARNAEVSAVSGDGRFVVFSSEADTFETRGDTNGAADVFLFDREGRSLRRISDASTDDQANADVRYPSLSADGRRVAFQSRASNLVPFDSNNLEDIFVRDLESGVVTRVSTPGDGRQGNRGSEGAVLAGGGGFVLFTSHATNLVSGDTNAAGDVFVRDLDSGALECVSRAGTGEFGDGESSGVALSADGRFVLFGSYAGNLVAGDTNGFADVFLLDRQTRALELISANPNGTAANGPSRGLSLSDDGRWVTFQSHATDLVPGVTTRERRGYVLDRTQHRLWPVETWLPSLPDGLEARGVLVSGDGLRWAIAARMACGAADVVDQVLLFDRTADRLVPISATAAGAWGDDHSFIGRFSANGRYLTFESYARNLLGEPVRPAGQVFVADVAKVGVDASVRRGSDGPWRGEAQADVRLQSVAATVVGGAAFPREFGFRVRNRGTDPERFLVQAPALPANVGLVRIQALTTPPEEIADAVLSKGWTTPWLRPGETLVFVVMLSLADDPVSDVFLEVRTTAVSDALQTEVVRMAGLADQDRDGLPDAWEKDWFGGLAITDGTRDSDGDGASDFTEWLAGTSPLDGGDALRLSIGESAGDGLPRVSWRAQPLVRYQLERAPDGRPFEAAGAELVRVGIEEVSVRDDATSGIESCRYRVRVEPP